MDEIHRMLGISGSPPVPVPPPKSKVNRQHSSSSSDSKKDDGPMFSPGGLIIAEESRKEGITYYRICGKLYCSNYYGFCIDTGGSSPYQPGDDADSTGGDMMMDLDDDIVSSHNFPGVFFALQLVWGQRAAVFHDCVTT